MPIPKKTPDDFISDAAKHANPAWKKAALRAVRKLATYNEVLTSADVLDALKKSKTSTHDLRAIGPIMSEARDRGLIQSVGYARQNGRTRAATVLWRSLVFIPEEGATTAPAIANRAA